jgi:hypothetical protein
LKICVISRLRWVPCGTSIPVPLRTSAAGSDIKEAAAVMRRPISLSNYVEAVADAMSI